MRKEVTLLIGSPMAIVPRNVFLISSLFNTVRLLLYLRLREFFQKLLAVLPDVARAHRDDDVVPLHDAEKRLRHVLLVGHVDDVLVAVLFRRIRDELAGDSLDRFLA